jgi:hypothetical protein
MHIDNSLSTCRNVDPDVFFPRTREKHIEEAIAHQVAAKYCNGCPNQTPCAVWGILFEADGIWGGLSAGERRQARKHLGVTVTNLSEPVLRSLCERVLPEEGEEVS